MIGARLCQRSEHGCTALADRPQRHNFVPRVALATLSNMDFQATLSTDAVIEYMTKYMTKSGQGAVVQGGS